MKIVSFFLYIGKHFGFCVTTSINLKTYLLKLILIILKKDIDTFIKHDRIIPLFVLYLVKNHE